MVKTIKLIGVLDYPDDIEEVMSVEEYIEKSYRKRIQGSSGKGTRNYNDRNKDLQRN